MLVHEELMVRVTRLEQQVDRLMTGGSCAAQLCDWQRALDHKLAAIFHQLKALAAAVADDSPALEAARRDLDAHTKALEAALTASGFVHHPVSKGAPLMAQANVQPVIDSITNADTVIDGAMVFIGSVPQLISDAVAAATTNGATAAELAPVTDLANTLKTKSDALKAAILANTPPAPTPPTP